MRVRAIAAVQVGLCLATLLATVTAASAETIQLTQISTTFNTPVGIDYHIPTNSIITSVYYPTGVPYNLERINFDGSHTQFSTLDGVTDEIKIATAKIDAGGFTTGEVFTGNGIDGEIVRISADGAVVQEHWVSLTGAGNGLMRGSLFVDNTGVWGYDLIAVTTAGEVWRIDAAAAADCSIGCTKIADVGAIHLEGMMVVPDDVATWGKWAGRIIAGNEDNGRLYYFDNNGSDAGTSGFQTGFGNVAVAIEDIDLIAPNMNFFGVNYAAGRILGAEASQFTSVVGEIMLTQETVAGGTSGLFHMRYDSASDQLVVAPFTFSGPNSSTNVQNIGQWEHVTFAAAGINEIPSTSVPEPSSLILLGSALAGAAARRRKSRR